jgi:hypothetical protein
MIDYRLKYIKYKQKYIMFKNKNSRNLLINELKENREKYTNYQIGGIFGIKDRGYLNRLNIFINANTYKNDVLKKLTLLNAIFIFYNSQFEMIIKSWERRIMLLPNGKDILNKIWKNIEESKSFKDYLHPNKTELINSIIKDDKIIELNKKIADATTVEIKKEDQKSEDQKKVEDKKINELETKMKNDQARIDNASIFTTGVIAGYAAAVIIKNVLPAIATVSPLIPLGGILIIANSFVEQWKVDVELSAMLDDIILICTNCYLLQSLVEETIAEFKKNVNDKSVFVAEMNQDIVINVKLKIEDLYKLMIKITPTKK